MPKYVIEREIPKVGEWEAEQLKEASKTSCNVLAELGRYRHVGKWRGQAMR